MLLVGIGGALIVESFAPESVLLLVPATLSLPGVLLGLALALVSSLLGVAGGELITPSFVLPSERQLRLL